MPSVTIFWNYPNEFTLLNKFWNNIFFEVVHDRFLNKSFIKSLIFNNFFSGCIFTGFPYVYISQLSVFWSTSKLSMCLESVVSMDRFLEGIARSTPLKEMFHYGTYYYLNTKITSIHVLTEICLQWSKRLSL